MADAGYDARHRQSSRRAIPPALAGTDLMVAAATGSGKTASFMLPALQRVLAARGDTTKRREKGTVYGPRILVLTPTRELAMQVAKAADDLRPPRAGPARRHRRRRRAVSARSSRRCAARSTS